MPSPFPGMDPYLEVRSWLNFHLRLAVEIADRINQTLKAPYATLVEERGVPSDPLAEDVKAYGRKPDVSIVRERVAQYGGRGRASAVAEPPIEMPILRPIIESHYWVEVITVQDRRLVTAIEILSPTNKTGHGRAEYLTKRQELLASSAHLLEIDLQRGGSRLPVDGELPRAPYYVFLSRNAKPRRSGIWPIQLTDHLPVVPVPLVEPDDDVPLDLQSCLTAIYDKSRYDFLTDYSEPPAGPLTDSESVFVAEITRGIAAK